MLRVRGTSTAWVLRYTAPTGRRREMGLGAALRGSLAQAGESVLAARRLAHAAVSCCRPASTRSMRGIKRAKPRRRPSEHARRRAPRSTGPSSALCARLPRARDRAQHHRQALSTVDRQPGEPRGSALACPLGSITAPALLTALQDAEAHERARNHRNLGETLRRVRQRLDAVFEDALFHGRCESTAG
jgi:hypothetical protein